MTVVVGPPGTGKTTYLIREVEKALARGVSPEAIGYISFTRKAANEAKERAMEKFKLPSQALPYFRTIHSLCFREIGLQRTGVVQHTHLREIGDMTGFRITGHFSVDEGIYIGHAEGDRMLFMHNKAKIHRRTLKEEYALDNDDLAWFDVEYFSKTYESFKTARGLVDFTDMLQIFCDRGLTPAFDVLFVDEAQDLSPLQWQVVEAMIGESNDTHIAGDDDQAIFRWAGADVQYFIEREGRVVNLDQSYRVPRSIQAVADTVIRPVASRRPKDWRPRSDGGSVQHVSDIADVDLSEGSWLVLVRNTFLIEDLEQSIRSNGYVYSVKDRHSVTPGTLQAVLGWERIRRGELINHYEAVAVYDKLKSGTGISRGGKKKLVESTDEQFDHSILTKQYGLLRSDPWFDALERIPEAERVYMQQALRQGEKITKEPRIRINTIHATKGGEAENVFIVTDMAYRTHQEYLDNEDDERRVWYVAVTRAKENLFIQAPKTSLYFPVLL